MDVEDRALTSQASSEEHPLFGLLRSLEASLVEGSKRCDLLLPLVGEIYACLNVGDYVAAIPLIDELEEFMDLEFCDG